MVGYHLRFAGAYRYRKCPKSRSEIVEFASNGSHVAQSQHLLRFAVGYVTTRGTCSFYSCLWDQMMMYSQSQLNVIERRLFFLAWSWSVCYLVVRTAHAWQSAISASRRWCAGLSTPRPPSNAVIKIIWALRQYPFDWRRRHTSGRVCPIMSFRVCVCVCVCVRVVCVSRT